MRAVCASPACASEKDNRRLGGERALKKQRSLIKIEEMQVLVKCTEFTELKISFLMQSGSEWSGAGGKRVSHKLSVAVDAYFKLQFVSK